MPPSFGDKSYWDARFAANPSTFDWLLPAGPLLSSIHSSLTTTPCPRILHIGCGTSSLSFHLKGLTGDPKKICNVDFSPIAVEAGKAQDGSMNWETLDLLSAEQVLEFKKANMFEDGGGGFGLIIDKSTADAISCASDVDVEFPYFIASNTVEGSSRKTAKIHPLAILSLHLAYLVAPGAKWLLLSYSSSRCSFLGPEKDGDKVVDQKALDEGFPDPRSLWRVVKEEALDAPDENNDSNSVVKRPVVKHTLYTLERSDFKLIAR
ncbi:hypothetical protein TWF730_003001 [Orbilia blumenaviensis]|uniref:Methyltransferase domain-containing protein n=1 Tax=Orbilia blumenaviensis TaxID=1796055 RepID=A0AAV9U8F1_9PEZI